MCRSQHARPGCTSVQEIVKRERVLKAYIYEAIEVEKAGLKVKLKKAHRIRRRRGISKENLTNSLH